MPVGHASISSVRQYGGRFSALLVLAPELGISGFAILHTNPQHAMINIALHSTP